MSGSDRWFPLIVGVFLIVTTVPAGAQSDLSISEFRYSGSGAVSATDDKLTLWQSERHEFQIVLSSSATAENGQVCLRSNADDSQRFTDITCQPISQSSGDGQTVTVNLDMWPSNLTGDQIVIVRMWVGNASSDLVSAQLRLRVLRKAGDLDGDGLTNFRESNVGTAMDRADTDNDNLDDHLEVVTYSTSPTKADTDGDGLIDGVEVKHTHTDPRSADTDGDGLTDDIEVNDLRTSPNIKDTDRDGLSDSEEVNTFGTNATNADTDGDNLGDGVEVNKYQTNPKKVDTDGDGLLDGVEVSIHGTDPTKADSDGDGLSDLSEITEHRTDPTQADTDHDGLDDGSEINSHGTDPNKPDSDGDGFSDSEELKRGTDPLAPTTHPQDGVIARLLAWVDQTSAASGQSRLGVFVGGGLLLILAGLSVFLWGSGRFPTRPFSSEPGHGNDDAAQTEEASVVERQEPSIMTKEERIIHLLESNGGRMRQSHIVDEHDWSKSTVSRVISHMESQGAVKKIDLGQENLISLPGHEPENSKPAFPSQ